MKICLHCQGQVSDDATICGHCGKRLAEHSPPLAAPVEKRRIPGWVWGLMGTVVGLVIIAVVLLGTGLVDLPGQDAAPTTVAIVVDTLPPLPTLPPDEPTVTPTPENTATPTSTPTPTVTPTPASEAVVLEDGAALRPGATTWWHPRETLPAGTEVELTGYDDDFPEWVYVRAVDGSAEGWTQLENLEVHRDLAEVPQMTPVPTLTPTPKTPAGMVAVDGFYIGRTEVTNKQYAACVAADACTSPWQSGSDTRQSYYGNSEFDDYPVIHVSWHQASAYCSWIGARLPTEEEWEKAARGTDGRTYPWGEGIDCTLANIQGCVGDTNAVGSYPAGASPYGVLDMAGNVWEWTATAYDAGAKVIHGGSWFNSADYARSTFRGWIPPTNAHNDIGFRCASSSD